MVDKYISFISHDISINPMGKSHGKSPRWRSPEKLVAFDPDALVSLVRGPRSAGASAPRFMNCGGTLQIVTICHNMIHKWYPPQLNSLGFFVYDLGLTLLIIYDILMG